MRESASAVQSVQRASEILDVFLENGDKPLSVAGLAKAVGLNRTTVWRLVTTLETSGYLERFESERYRLGMKMFYFANAVQNRFDVRRAGHRVMERLCRETDESIYLQIAVDHHRVCIHAVESSNPIRHQISVGEILPLYAGAAGKLLLAYWPPEAVERYLRQTVLTRLCANTVLDPETLRRDLDKIRESGYALTQDERFSGSCSVAAPIIDYANKVIAALSIAGPSNRMVDRQDFFIQEVLSAAQEISQLMGFRKDEA